MRCLWILLLLPLSGCVSVQRHSTAAVQASLEEKAAAYQRAQEQRVYDVSARLMQQIPDPPQVTFVVPTEATLYAGTTYGKLVITTGMIRFANSDDELAMVIGH